MRNPDDNACYFLTAHSWQTNYRPHNKHNSGATVPSACTYLEAIFAWRLLKRTLENRYQNCRQIRLPSNQGASVGHHPVTRCTREARCCLQDSADVFLNVRFCELPERSVEKMASQTHHEEKKKQRYKKIEIQNY